MATAAPPEPDPATIPGSDARHPFAMPWRAWKAIFARLYVMIGYHNVTLMAAGVAFYSFLAFVPLLGAIVMTYGLVADPATVSQHMQTIIQLVPADAARLIRDQLLAVATTASGQAGLGLAVALGVSLYGATRSATAIIQALNVIYEENEERNIVRTTLLAFQITIGAVLIAVMGIVAASILAYLQVAADVLGDAGVTAIKLVTWIVAAALASAGFAFVYRYGPDRRHARWQWLTVGSVAATLLWLLATLGFGLYVAYFADYNATYGSLGAVVVLLMWLFVSSLAILLGAELNAEIERQTTIDTTVGHERPRGRRGATVADTLPTKRQHRPDRSKY